MIRLAVLADPHLHDTDWTGPPGLIRTLRDTAASTRVFNESIPAFRQALAMIAAEAIRLVVIVGDLTDDGQPVNWATARAVLAEHKRQYGTQFFWLPGNHDQWGNAGLPLIWDQLLPDSRVETLAGPAADANLRMVGMAEAMTAAHDLGQVPRQSFIHWETPFGVSALPTDRIPPGGNVPDASFLVEPIDGLWLLLIDANVWLPDGNGGFADQSPNGWAAVLDHKAWLLDWMADVAARAQAGGKRLLAFSHFPVSDPFRGVMARLADLGSGRTKQRRMPTDKEALRIAATGLTHHFSGHWHIAARSRDPGGQLLNISVPSTVAFPAGFAVVEIEGGQVSITDRHLATAPGQARQAGAYLVELLHRPDNALEALIRTTTYPAFLSSHHRHIVLTRRLHEDWPQEMAGLIDRVTLADLAGPDLATTLRDLPMIEMLVDWYRLRETGGGPMAGIDHDRRSAYRSLNARGENLLLDTFATTLSTLASPTGAQCA